MHKANRSVSGTWRQLLPLGNKEAPTHTAALLPFLFMGLLKFLPLPAVRSVMHEDFEKKHVHSFYAEESHEFSFTRYRAWPKVEEFYRKHVRTNDLVLDAGSGNGRNTLLPETSVALDYSNELLMLSSQKRDCLAHSRADLTRPLPLKDGVFDVAISIAVLHHVLSEGRRRSAVKSIFGALKQGGLFLLYVWSSTPVDKKSKFLPIPQLKKQGAGGATLEGQVPADSLLCSDAHLLSPEEAFGQNDVFVAWKNKNKLDRYYHLFAEGEAEALVISAGFHISESGYDHGNYFVICRK